MHTTHCRRRVVRETSGGGSGQWKNAPSWTTFTLAFPKTIRWMPFLKKKPRNIITAASQPLDPQTLPMNYFTTNTLITTALHDDKGVLKWFFFFFLSALSSYKGENIFSLTREIGRKTLFNLTIKMLYKNTNGIVVNNNNYYYGGGGGNRLDLSGKSLSDHTHFLMMKHADFFFFWQATLLPRRQSTVATGIAVYS